MSNSEYYQALDKQVIKEYECLKSAEILLERQRENVQLQEERLLEAKGLLEILQRLRDNCERNLEMAEDEAGDSAENILSAKQ